MAATPRDPEDPGLPEPLAERVIARAIALDSASSSRVPLERLREIANEIGISNAILEQALAETLQGARPVAAVRRRRTGYLARLGRRLMGRTLPEDIESEPDFLTLRAVLEGLATNLLAFAAFWVPTLVILVFARTIGLFHSGPVDTLALILCIAAGVLLARRLSARLTMWGLGMVMVAVIVDLVTQLSGASAQRGFFGSTAFLLMLAASFGMAMGALLMRRRARTGDGASGGPDAVGSAAVDESSQGRQRAPDWPFLRLGLAKV